MSVYHPVQATCSCGNTFEARAAHSVNAQRSPAVRTAILDGTFHRSFCPTCGKAVTIETPFFYTDLKRKSVFMVKPRGERYLARRDSERLSHAVGFIPPSMISKRGRQLRVVYGLDELREKLVAQDAGYDDGFIELAKVFVLHEHPFLLHKQRLQLHLTAVQSDKVEFTAYHHNLPETYAISMPRSIVDGLNDRRPELDAWVEAAHPPASPGGPQPGHFWVNFRNWSVRYSALEVLNKLAEDIRNGGEPELAGADFERLLRDLRSISQLPSRAKAELRTVFDYARKKKNDAVQAELFEIRYGVELEDEWALNSRRDDIVALWQLFRDLPPSNIEGNTELKKVELIAGSNGYYQWEGVIQIGEGLLGSDERFEDTLRHEVGHAVHDQRMSLINAWLKSEFGWETFPRNAAGVNAWVAAMGGWGGLTSQQRSECTTWLISALGPSQSWNPGPAPTVPAGHPWRGANFGPRLAYEQTGANWYRNIRNWHRANGKAFFLNYWYATFMVVNESTLELVARMPSNYAAMSHYEFFAELYSLYYDQDDPRRDVIPAAVGQWLDANVGVRDPASPSVPGAPGPVMRSPRAAKKAAVKRASSKTRSTPA